jgi:hypothetical protein
VELELISEPSAGAAANRSNYTRRSAVREDYAAPELIEFPPLTDVTGVTGDSN